MKKLFLFIRSLLSSVVFAVSVIIVGSIVILITFFSTNRKFQDVWIGAWSKLALFLFGLRVKVKGLENVPADSCLLMFNHVSHFDIIAIQALVPRVRFGAKIELFSFPVFGTAMRRAGVLPIARSRIDEVKKVYKAAEARVKDGDCFALAPEGTRQDQEEIGKFKSGPFIFAINAGIPIVPVVLTGCHGAFPKKDWMPALHNWTSDITVTFGEPIPVTKGNLHSKLVLQEQVHTWMVNNLRVF